MYYLKTTNKEDFKADMKAAGLDIDDWTHEGPYSAPGITIDWIGQLPIFDEAGELTGFEEDALVNIHQFAIPLVWELFEHTSFIHPSNPTRIFG